MVSSPGLILAEAAAPGAAGAGTGSRPGCRRRTREHVAGAAARPAELIALALTGLAIAAAGALAPAGWAAASRTLTALRAE
jgi:hypothetical protein